MTKKILVGIVTSELHSYCLDRLLDALNSQTFRDFDVLFVDNSETDYSNKINEKGYDVIRDSKKDTRIDNIISGRNILRKECLERGYEFLFFLDSDVIPPENAFESIISHGKMLVTGVYLTVKNINGKIHVFPCLAQYVDDRHIRVMKMDDVKENNLIEIGLAGLGCCLIHRNILQKTEFRNGGSSTTGGEDSAFFHDAKKAGFTAYADTSVKCFHMCYPEGDQKNEFYKFK